MKRSILFFSLLIFSIPTAFCQKDTISPYAPIERPAGSDTSEKKVFTKIEIDGQFPGGEEAWNKFLQKNLNTRVPTRNHAPKGIYTVMIRFFINPEGVVTETFAETTIGYGMEEEVMRVIKKSPTWIPAKQNGKFVRMTRRQPVNFVVP